MKYLLGNEKHLLPNARKRVKQWVPEVSVFRSLILISSRKQTSLHFSCEANQIIRGQKQGYNSNYITLPGKSQ